MVEHKDSTYTAPQTCEICGGKTPQMGLCPRCEDWVEHYAESASAHLFSVVDETNGGAASEMKAPLLS